MAKRQRELEARRKVLREEMDAISKELNDLYDAKTLPPIKAKYEGKFFKEWVAGESGQKGFWVYAYVRTVDHQSSFTGVEFRAVREGTSYYRTDATLHKSMLGKEISKAEFLKAHAAMVKHIAFKE